MTTLTDAQLADLRARITKGPWELMLGSYGRNRICATYPCINGLSALFTIAHVNVPEESERGYTDDAFNPDVAAANAEAIALVPDLLDEVVRLREAFSNCRKWPFRVIPMPFTADGKGPATIGVDAARIAYEVWDTVYICHASFDNLPDAINEAMRLTVAALATEKTDG